jgi:ribosomal protein S24E
MDIGKLKELSKILINPEFERLLELEIKGVRVYPSKESFNAFDADYTIYKLPKNTQEIDDILNENLEWFREGNLNIFNSLFLFNELISIAEVLDSHKVFILSIEEYYGSRKYRGLGCTYHSLQLLTNVEWIKTYLEGPDTKYFYYKIITRIKDSRFPLQIIKQKM